MVSGLTRIEILCREMMCRCVHLCFPNCDSRIVKFRGNVRDLVSSIGIGQDKAKGMDAYSSSSTLYIMYSTISKHKHNASLQQQVNCECEQVPIKYSRGRG
jgi:hypothetical protein